MKLLQTKRCDLKAFAAIPKPGDVFARLDPMRGS